MSGTIELVEELPLTSPPAPKLDVPELAALYEEHSKAIYYLALRFLGEPSQAEDVTHDVFLKAYRKLNQFKGDSSIRTWLYRITINHCNSLLASWHHRHMQSTGDDTIWESGAGESDSPFRVLEIKELGERIQRALDDLTPEYRLLLLLVADDKLAYDEIAALTEQSSDAVRGKLHRARKAFAIAFARTG
jgi:RNA polymerase sigma-70 factor (ECF subfamily)